MKNEKTITYYNQAGVLSILLLPSPSCRSSVTISRRSASLYCAAYCDGVVSLSVCLSVCLSLQSRLSNKQEAVKSTVYYSEHALEVLFGKEVR